MLHIMLHMNDITNIIKKDIDNYNDGLHDDIGCIDSIMGICREYLEQELEQERCKSNTRIDDIETILGYNENDKWAGDLVEYYYCGGCGYEAIAVQLKHSRTYNNKDYYFCPMCNEENSIEV